jgi:hypothetical protein
MGGARLCKTFRFRDPPALGTNAATRQSGIQPMTSAAVAAADPTSIPIARAFLALGDTVPSPPPPRVPRRVRAVAALCAAVTFALAAPLSAAGLAAADADDHAAGTLPGKTWVAGAADDDGADAGGG